MNYIISEAEVSALYDVASDLSLFCDVAVAANNGKRVEVDAGELGGFVTRVADRVNNVCRMVEQRYEQSKGESLNHVLVNVAMLHLAGKPLPAKMVNDAADHFSRLAALDDDAAWVNKAWNEALEHKARSEERMT